MKVILTAYKIRYFVMDLHDYNPKPASFIFIVDRIMMVHIYRITIVVIVGADNHTHMRKRRFNRGIFRNKLIINSVLNRYIINHMFSSHQCLGIPLA